MAKQERIIRNGLDPVPPEVHETGGKELTQQSMKEETDINTIVRQFMKTGNLGQPGTRQPMFGDFSADTYHDMVNKIADAELAFATLPSRVRDRFQNDPYQVIRFLDNPDNLKEAIKLGLVPEPAEEPVKEAAPAAAMASDPEANSNKKAE